MKRRTRISVIASATLVVCLGLSVVTLRAIDRARGDSALQDVLYIPSANTVKRLSLGYNGLLADIYWTRVVQYFGGKHHERSKEYQLLAPLLDITTTLDPQLLPAYEFGSVFLAQNPPEGAGDPRAAVRLVSKGIQQNPEAWRLWYQLGFIYWMELHDTKSAAEAFMKGSQVPGALPWMKVMAAMLAQHAGEAETSRYLWTNIYESTEDATVRRNAAKRLMALKSDEEVQFLDGYVQRYKEQTGHTPASLKELVTDGWLRQIPRDPAGNPYRLENGRVVVSSPEELPFITKGLPAGREASDVPALPSK